MVKNKDKIAEKEATQLSVIEEQKKKEAEKKSILEKAKAKLTAHLDKEAKEKKAKE